MTKQQDGVREFERIWVLFKRNISPGPVPYATLGPIVGSVAYIPESALLKAVAEARASAFEEVREYIDARCMKDFDEILDKAKTIRKRRDE